MVARDDFDDFFGDDDEPQVVDTRADGRLYRVPLTRIAPNLVNPRTDFGTEDQLLDLGKSLARQQNQPCPVVSRTAYLKLWPEHADRIKDADYILVSGERRYRAATVVGLAGLDCVANDAFAKSRRSFIEAVVSENVDRQNFDPVEEAYAVQSLVAEFGSNRAVAQHFERADGWVTQRVCLTYLAPELQQQVRAKEISLELARSLGSKAKKGGWDLEQQTQWLKEERERLAQERLAKRQRSQPAVESDVPVTMPPPVRQPATTGIPASGGREAGSFTAVKPAAVPPAVQEPAAPSVPPAVESVAPVAAAEGVPGPRGEEAAQDTTEEGSGLLEQPLPAGKRDPARFPYANGDDAAWHLEHKMPEDEFSKMVARVSAVEERRKAERAAAS